MIGTSHKTVFFLLAISDYFVLFVFFCMGVAAWVFEDANDEQPYLYYVPYRPIPTLPTAQTLSPNGETGRHKFALVPSKLNDEFTIGVQDDIMPHPGIVHFHQPLLGITWTLTHMSRMMNPDTPSVDTLQKYLNNIMEDPASVKYRQIRTASKNFAPIWQSPMRGLLHAVGFVEVGAYAELGCHDYPLSRDRVQEVALLSYLLTQWRFKPTADAQSQPEGALDGYGRAGFSRAGTSH
jgi:PUB domain